MCPEPTRQPTAIGPPPKANPMASMDESSRGLMCMLPRGINDDEKLVDR